MNVMNKIKKTAGLIEKAMNLLFLMCGMLTILFVLLITVFLVTSGIPAIQKIGLSDFLLESHGHPLLFLLLMVSCLLY